MVIEKLKEREDAKDAREEQEMLVTLEGDINAIQSEMGELELKLYQLFDQYLMLKGERHPEDFRDL